MTEPRTDLKLETIFAMEISGFSGSCKQAAMAALQRTLAHFEDEARSPAREGLREALTERWLARVEWNGNGSRAEWRCLVCGQYDRHRVDAEDYCPIAWVLASLSDPAPQR